MDIRPTLFIGLGTSGVRVIQEFRRLMFEQFTEAGLPIFQYLALETDAQAPAIQSDLPEEYTPKDYEKIKLLAVTVPHPENVTALLRDPRYAQMKRWINPVLLRTELAVNAGARHIRMLGRLALWMNWNDVKTSLINVQGAAINPGNQKRSREILEQRLNLPPGGVNILPGFDIYILGTLCGGTCGGMLIDMAYQVQKLFAMQNVLAPAATIPRIYAIMTMLDTALAGMPAANRQAANCWASLLELDWYMDTRTTYNYSLPGDPEYRPTYFSPVSFVQLVSRTNTMNEIFPGDIEHFHGDGINRMVALKIFNNIMTRVDGQIASFMVNEVASGRKTINDAEHTRTMISFGTSALWNPKYRLAQEFAAHQAELLCERLIGKPSQARTGIIRALAEREWQGIRSHCLRILTAMPGQTTVDGVLNDLLRNIEQRSQDLEINELPNFLLNYPSTTPPSLKDRFLMTGAFSRTMKEMTGQFKTDLRDRLQALLEQQLNDLDPTIDNINEEKILNLQEMKLFIEQLQLLIRRDTEGVPPVLPEFAFNPRPIPPGVSLSSSIWLTMLGKGGKAAERYKAQVVRDYRDSVDRHFKACRRYFATSGINAVAIAQLNQKLGDINGYIQLLTGAKQTLSTQRGAAQSWDQADFHNIVAVADTNYSAVLTARYAQEEGANRRSNIERILTQIPKADGTEGQAFWKDLFCSESANIAELLKYPFFAWALGQHDATDLADEAIKRFGQDATLVRLALRSYPYWQRGITYRSIRSDIKGNLEYLCGKSRQSSGSIADLSHHIKSRDPSISFSTYDSPLDNVVVFYREEPPFFIDDLAAADVFKDRYEAMSGPQCHDLHTEMGREFYNKGILVHLEPIQLTLEGIQLLYPLKAFEKFGDRFVLRYTKPNGIADSYEMTTEAHRSEFCRKISLGLTSGDGAAMAALDTLKGRIRNVLEEQGRSNVTQRQNQLLGEWLTEGIDTEEKNRRNRAVEVLIQETFPEG